MIADMIALGVSTPLPKFLYLFYRAALVVLAGLLLGFYLACTVYGVIALCFYDNLSGLGLMAVGLLLFQGGRLALSEINALAT